MLRIKENKDEIIVRAIPIRGWITAGVVALILIFIITAWLISRTGVSGAMWIIPYLVFLGGVLFFILQTSPATTIKINKPGETVSIRKQSFSNYSFDVYSFNEIADFIYIDAKLVGRPGHETTSYEIIMPLKSNTNIELPAYSGLKDNEYFDIIDLMNSYIFDTSKQIPFKLTILNDD